MNENITIKKKAKRGYLECSLFSLCSKDDKYMSEDSRRPFKKKIEIKTQDISYKFYPDFDMSAIRDELIKIIKPHDSKFYSIDDLKHIF